MIEIRSGKGEQTSSKVAGGKGQYHDSLEQPRKDSTRSLHRAEQRS